MENNFDPKPSFGSSGIDQKSMPLRIFSISAVKAEQSKEGEEEAMNFNMSDSDAFSTAEIAREGKGSLSHSWTEGSWAFQRSDIDEELPSLEVRHEAMKRVFQSLEQTNGRASRLETSRIPGENMPSIGASDKDESDEFFVKLKEAVEKRVSDNISRLSNPNMNSGDIFGSCESGKPKSAPSGEMGEAEKQYHFPELRTLIDDRIEETKVETLTNRLERELMRRQNLCNEQALMLQMLLNRVQDLEKRQQPKRGGTAPANGWSRQARGVHGMCCCTSNYVVEKATQTPSDVHDAEGVYVMVARNSGAKAKKVQRRFAYGYPERITEEKKVSTFLDRKVVTQHIEFLPPIPDPFAKKRPRDAKKPGWHTM